MVTLKPDSTLNVKTLIFVVAELILFMKKLYLKDENQILSHLEWAMAPRFREPSC